MLAVYTSGLSYGAGGNVDNAYADGQSAGSVICGQLAVLFKTYVEEQARLAQEQAEKEAEAARLAEEEAKAEAEEQARLAEEQKAAEEAAAEAARQAELQRQAEEQQRLAEEQKAAEEAARQAELQRQAEEQQRLAEEQKAAEEAAAEQARQTAHRKLLLRIGGVGIFSILVIALAVVLIRKLHKAGKC